MAINIHYWDDTQGFFVTVASAGTGEVELPYEGKMGILLYYDYVQGDETELKMRVNFKDPRVGIFFTRAKIDSVNNILLNDFVLTGGKASFGISLSGNERVKIDLEFVGATTEGTIDLYVLPTLDRLPFQNDISSYVFL